MSDSGRPTAGPWSRSARAIDYVGRHMDRYVAELSEFVAIPSISTLSEQRPAMRRAADWLSSQLIGLGFQKVEIMPTAGHPVVCGEWLDAPGRPTVLIYGHYDVQPVDPLDEWLSPPFEPEQREDYLYGRGTSDMKGQCHAILKAIEALLQTGGLPINVRVLIEGEEEIESPHLPSFLDEERDRLACDLVINCDSGILRPDLPSLVYGLRGLAYFELWVHGPQHDLHSGAFGGSVHNPAQVLCELIAGMHDAAGRVTLPGFYDRVRVLSAAERCELKKVPSSDAEWLAITGVTQLYGEDGFTTVERIGARPTLEVNGLVSGYTCEGAKTVIPARAMAKLSVRLVPDQDDQAVEAQLRAYFQASAPPTVKWELTTLARSPAILLSQTEPVAAAARALKATFGVEPAFTLSGASVPVVGMLKDRLGVDSVIMGFGLPDDNPHAPNERLHIPTFRRGIECYIRFFEGIAELSEQRVL